MKRPKESTPVLPKKIFIVDDTDFMVEMLCMIVRGGGYTVVGTALDGAEALETIGGLTEDLAPDIVTVDFHMPGMDGMETIRRIRSLVPGVRVVLISSHATFSVVMQARETGVDAFVAKPFEPQTVLEAIEKIA
jgi:two-component system chemotaxis response regulator CheY